MSVVLMFIDHRQQHLAHLRATLSTLTTPLVYLANLPADIFDWGTVNLRSREQLEEENRQLRDELLVVKGQVQRLVALEAENARLRNLLGSASRARGRRLVAEILSVAEDKFSDVVVLDKGSSDGVFVGQVVIDADGIVGQVIETSTLTSRVLLITDSRHAMPVRVARNGIRAIAYGTGETEQLVLRHVPDTADIQVNDLLLSSGLGQRFPDGYPVARVTRADHDPGAPFALVEATPLSAMDRTGQVLLVWPDPERSLRKRQPQASPDSAQPPATDPASNAIDEDTDANGANESGTRDSNSPQSDADAGSPDQDSESL